MSLCVGRPLVVCIILDANETRQDSTKFVLSLRGGTKVSLDDGSGKGEREEECKSKTRSEYCWLSVFLI